MMQFATITAKHCHIFAPKEVGAKKPKYFVGFDAEDLPIKFDRQGIPSAHSIEKPKIFIMGLTIMQSAAYLHDKFANLHWTGFEPDEIVKGRPMKIGFTICETERGEFLALREVTLFKDEIWSAMQRRSYQK